MPFLSGGDAANDNQPVRASRPCLRLDLAPDVWSDDSPATAMATWTEDIWCGAIAGRPAPDLRLMPTTPD